MIYTWRCLKCGEEVEVERVVADIEMWPSRNEGACDCGDVWQRIMKFRKNQVLMEKAYDEGVFERPAYKGYGGKI